VAIENDEMVGLIYFKNYFGLYVVKNHALFNKKDEAKNDYMPSGDYQYRILRAKSFVGNSDILMAYINDPKIKSMTLENDFQEMNFPLTDNKKLIFRETQQLFTIVKTQSDTVEEILIKWKNKNIQDVIKYDTSKLVLSSKVPISIAVIGELAFKTDNSIKLDAIELSDVRKINSQNYDALFVNVRISNERVDELVKTDWDVYIIDPLNNLEKANNNIDVDVIITRRGSNGSWNSYKGSIYDSKSTYYREFNYIFNYLSDRKE